MRRPRIKAEGAGYYHCMSRIIERRHILGDSEKERLHKLMRGLAAFGGLDILTYCFMSNHFHILVRVPERQDVSDEELLRRLAFLLNASEVKQIAHQLQNYRAQGQIPAAEALKQRFTYRMFDISEFFKALKQRFSQAYNVREDRCGPLWEQRFKSVLVECSEDALLTMAAYTDLNPVRARLVTDPKVYRYSGYGEAMGGGKEAREGLRRLMQAAAEGGRLSWPQAYRLYRQRLYVQGRQKGVDPEGRTIRRQGFTPEEVEKVLAADGRLPMHELLRCRVRYFSDGLALGSQDFLERVFQRYRGHFGPNRQTGARPMRFGEWGSLCTLRDLRKAPVSTS
jgi:putative transposase